MPLCGDCHLKVHDFLKRTRKPLYTAHKFLQRENKKRRKAKTRREKAQAKKQRRPRKPQLTSEFVQQVKARPLKYGSATGEARALIYKPVGRRATPTPKQVGKRAKIRQANASEKQRAKLREVGDDLRAIRKEAIASGDKRRQTVAEVLMFKAGISP